MTKLEKIIKEEESARLEKLLKEFEAEGYQLRRNSKKPIDLRKAYGRYFIELPYRSISLSELRKMKFITDDMNIVTYPFISSRLLLDTKISISGIW